MNPHTRSWSELPHKAKQSPLVIDKSLGWLIHSLLTIVALMAVMAVIPQFLDNESRFISNAGILGQPFIIYVDEVNDEVMVECAANPNCMDVMSTSEHISREEYKQLIQGE